MHASRLAIVLVRSNDRRKEEIMTKTYKAALVFAVAFALSAPDAIYASTPNNDGRSRPGDDTVITRVVKAIKRVVRTILEQPAVPIPDDPSTH